MTERTHFRCNAFGLLTVARCQAHRALPLGAKVSRTSNVPSGEVRPLSCRDCPQAAGVDAGTEPTLATLAELEGQVQARPPARKASALPPDSPLLRKEPVGGPRRRAAPNPAPAERDVPAAMSPRPQPPAPASPPVSEKRGG